MGGGTEDRVKALVQMQDHLCSEPLYFIGAGLR